MSKQETVKASKATSCAQKQEVKGLRPLKLSEMTFEERIRICASLR